MRSLLTLAAVASGCTAPSYGNGHLQCAPSNACPSGFYCASDQHCWRNGSGPAGGGGDLAVGTDEDLASALVDLAGADLAKAPSKCGSNSGVLLCEGFENGLVANSWGQSGNGGVPSVDTTHAFRGVASLRAHLDAAAAMRSPHATIGESHTFPVAGTLYARVWAYFPSPLPDSFEQFLNFVDASSTGISVASDGGHLALNDYASTLYQKSTTLLPLDRWTCVQFDMSQGTTTGPIHISVDGQLLADLPQSGTTTTAIGVSVGLDFYGNSVPLPAYDAWFDELILDNKPTSCDE
jgi:hypothetical protein